MIIIINDYSIIYKYLNYFASTIAPSNSFCVKLLYANRVAADDVELPSRSGHLFCEFYSLEECK